METFAILPPETANNEKKIANYTQTESVEDLLYEFIRDRTPTTAASYRDDLKAFFDFTSKYFQIPRAEGDRVHFEDIKRVHIVKYKNFVTIQLVPRAVRDNEGTFLRGPDYVSAITARLQSGFNALSRSFF